MGFSRQECWSGLPFPSREDLPSPGTRLASPALLLALCHYEHWSGYKHKPVKPPLVDYLSTLQPKQASPGSASGDTGPLASFLLFLSLWLLFLILTCRHGFLCMSITNNFCFHVACSSPVKIIYTHLGVNVSIGIKVICGLSKPFQKRWVCRIRRI